VLYLRLVGGLGNQLFQLAAASFLSEYYSCGIRIATDVLSSYKSPRSPDAIKLLKPIPNTEIETRRGFNAMRLLHRMRAGRWLFPIAINDTNFDTIHAAKRPKSCICLMDGYFFRGWSYHTLKFASRHFHCSEELSKYQTASQNSKAVLMHIRGTDFLGSREFNICSFSFYVEAIRIALEKGYQDFAIITDDKRYASDIICKLMEVYPSIKLDISSTGSSIGDFMLLKQAKFRITGNSTFAFWASFMANTESITISSSRLTSTIPKPFKMDNEVWI
jgi:hypothetical protein